MFKVWGKTNLPVFAQLFQDLGIDLICLFDADDEAKLRHKEANAAIRATVPSGKIIEMTSNLESETGYVGEKADALALMDYLEEVELDPKFNLSEI